MEEDYWQDFKKSVKKITKKPKVSTTYKPLPKKLDKKTTDISFDEYGILYDKTVSYTKKQAKSLRKTDVENTIDLHGKTTKEAFIALKSFLIESREKGIRCIIAICGKGINERFEFQGKIKRNIEHWLEGFKQSNLISHYITAEKKRGGEGAYRIYLKI